VTRTLFLRRVIKHVAYRKMYTKTVTLKKSWPVFCIIYNFFYKGCNSYFYFHCDKFIAVICVQFTCSWSLLVDTCITLAMNAYKTGSVRIT
jgi:hypothetical protein